MPDVRGAKLKVYKRGGGKEVYVGPGWYTLCKALNMKDGDTISFWNAGNPQELHVQLVRFMDGNGN